MTNPPPKGSPSAGKSPLAGGLKGWKLVAVFAAGALVGALSAVEIVPNFTGASASGPGETAGGAVSDGGGSSGGAVTGDSSSATGKGKGATSAGGTSGAAAAAGGSSSGGGSGGLTAGRPGLECSRSGNGGATDRGVTADSVKMATTVAESGPGAAFLGQVRYGMEAVRNQINSAGGICGRALEIEYRDDGWDAARGAQYLRNFIQEGVFAIPVCPSSEGCRVVIDGGDLDKSQTPMPGSDGMLIDQYQRSQTDTTAQPYVWPVAAATVSSARIMCQDAYKRGARHFSIVFDKNYRFGVEAAQAFNACVKRLTGKNIPGYNTDNNCVDNFCGITGGASSYSTDAATFKEGDFVSLFLEPTTAQAWMADPNTSAPSAVKYGYGAGQPLFTKAFATQCRAKCDQMQIWTGFKPPIEAYANQPAVKKYVEDLKRTKPDGDEFNAFTEGGYVGMLLLEQAMKAVGPDLTRARLQQALNSTCLTTGLTIQPRVCFNPNNRYANTTMQAFAIQYKGSFGGWRAGAIVKDPGV